MNFNNTVEGIEKEGINSSGPISPGNIIYYDCLCKKGTIIHNSGDS